jgi:hypothetical protein
MDYYTTTRASTPLDDESPGYSPVLENYTSFYAEEIQQEIKQEKPVPPTTKTMTRSDSLSSNIHQININRNNSLNSENSNTTSSSSPLNSHLSPPVSPSFLRPEFMATKEDVLFAPRSSSLNRAMSTTSNKSIVKLSQRNNSLSNQQPGSPLFSNPTSPLASFVHPNALYNNNVDEFPNHAFVSYITPHLSEAVARLNERRRIFCTAEYSLSFNGEEALDLIRSFLPSNLDDWIYLDYARSLMRNNVIHPIAYSEKSILNNRLYDTPTEVYTINEDEDVEAIQCVYTPLTRCYTNSCFPGQGGCYAPLCPNKAEKGLSTAASIGSSTSHETVS